MTTAAPVEIPVSLEAEQAKSDAASLSKNILGGLTPVVDVAQLAGKALNLAGDAVARLIQLGQESIKLAAEQQRAERELETALKLRGAYSAAALQDLIDYSDQLEVRANVDQNVTLGLQKQLLVMGVHRSQLKEATEASLGLAEVLGSVDGAARAVAATLDGESSGALKKLNLEGKNSYETFQKLHALFDLTAERAQTFEGRIAGVENAWEDMVKTFGTVVVQNPEILEFLDEAKQGLGDITEYLGKADFKWFISEVGDAASAVLSGLRKVVTFVKDNRTELEFVLGAGLRAVPGGGLLATGVRAARGVLGLLSEEEKEEKPQAPYHAPGDVFDDEEKLQIPYHAPRGVFDDDRKKKPEKLVTESDLDRVLTNMRDTAAARGELIDQQIEKEQSAAEWEVMQLGKRLEANKAYENALLEMRKESDWAEQDRRIQNRERLAEEDRKVDEQREKQLILEEQRAEMAKSVMGLALNGVTSMVRAAAADQEVALDKIAGGIIQSIGQVVVQLGTSALVGGLLGSSVPFLFGYTGGPAAIAAGAAAIIAGEAIIFAGAKLGGSSSRAGASVPRPAAVGARPSSSSFEGERGFEFNGGENAPASNVYHINFYGTVGDPRRAARQALDAIRSAQSLQSTTLKAG